MRVPEPRTGKLTPQRPLDRVAGRLCENSDRGEELLENRD